MPTSIELEFEFRGQRFKNAARGLALLGQRLGTSLDKAGPVARKNLLDTLNQVAAELKRRHSRKWNYNAAPLPSGPKGQLAQRSGDMISGIENSVKVIGSGLNNLSAFIEGPAIHEFGGTIRPRRSQYLAIPLPPALDSRGLPLRISPREWPNTFVLKSRKGNLLIVRRTANGIEPLYVLKRSVKIPPRLGLEDVLNQAVDPFQNKLFNAITRALSLEGVTL